MWVPGKTSSLCSEHFTADDFERQLNVELNLTRELKKDSIGVCVYPTKHAKREGEDDEPPSKRSRDKRMIARSAKSRFKTLGDLEATANVTYFRSFHKLSGDYLEDIFQFLLGLNKQQLQDAAIELKQMTPDHMGSMLVDKESREEAIRKREERLRMVTRDVPPTPDPAAGPSSLPAVPDQTERQPRGQAIRARPVCSACKNPMRGHKFVTDCP